MNLFTAQSADADGDKTVQHNGGFGSFFAKGTFGSGTAKLQWTPDGTSWFDVPNSALTADGMVTVQMPPGKVRASLSGSTDPSVDAGFIGDEG